MSRNLWLVSLAVILVTGRIAWSIWSGWGLITVHAKAEPLGKVIAQIERQGGVTLRTDLKSDTQVTMNVEKVPLTEALETLATVTDARWRLAYFMADDKTKITSAIGS